MKNMRLWIWFLTLIPMKYNADFYKRFNEIIAVNIMTTAPCWMSFLETMSRNSKRSIQELLMIHYQRPEARDCKSYQEWIKAGRQVKRGSIGIAIRDKENPEKVRYLFGIDSTVGEKKTWRFEQKLEPEVMKAIQAEFHTNEAFSFPSQVEYAVSLQIDRYWDDHEREILDGIMECWKGWDEYAAKLQFVDAAFYSTCYMILERCGYRPQSMYEDREFACVPSFYTPNAMAALGETIRAVGDQVLDVIAKTITEKTIENSIAAEGEKSPSAFLKHKSNKKDKEVR